MNLTKHEVESIKNKIKESELKTSGEIVPVLISKSDSYLYTHYLNSLIFTFLGLLLSKYELVSLELNQTVLLFSFSLIGYLLPYFDTYKKMLLTKKEIDEEVTQRTLQAFYNNHLHKTKDGTGVLIFISLLEKRINIIGDYGINAKVDQNYWDSELEILARSIKNNEITNGLKKVIERIGDRLSEHFPIQDDDENELKNDLITDLKIT
jgi:putative membrane protein